MGKATFQLRSRMAIEGDRRGVKMTYRLLSKEAKVSTSTLSRMANNEQGGIALDTLQKICTVLRCTPNDLLWVEEPEPAPGPMEPGTLVYDEPKVTHQVLHAEGPDIIETIEAFFKE